MAEMKESWTSLASLLATLAFCQTLLQVVFPLELRSASLRFLMRALGCYSSYCYFDVAEWDGDSTNELYNAVQLCLSSLASASCSRLSLSHARNSSATTFVLSKNDRIADVFDGVAVRWEHVVTQRQSQTSSWRPQPDEKRGFTLRIRKRDKDLILYPYLDYITDKADDIRRNNRERLIYTNSSMIAAMANFLGYDIYDLELTEVSSNSELRRLLMKTSSKSIIVIEDIDCSTNLSDRSKVPQGPALPRSFSDPGAPDAASGSKDRNNNTITLSGLLNFTDGLWSCCGSERIFVFTTNHIDELDPALLWSGRMDMHIYMSYCSYPALEILLWNYLGCEAEDLGEAAASKLREVVEKAKMTPADISEVLIKNKRNKEKAVSELLEVLKARAERKEKYGGLREERESNRVEEEEEEKRALESPREGSDCDDDSCKTVEDDEVENKAK